MNVEEKHIINLPFKERANQNLYQRKAKDHYE